MKSTSTTRAVLAGLAVCLVAGTLGAQRPRGQRPQNRSPQAAGKQTQQRQIPDDPKLLELHREFVAKAARLAKDYERTNQIEKARACYEQILKLLPGHSEAEEALAKIIEKQATAERRVFSVYANKDWQDTDVRLVQGKPITIQARGTWNFKMSHELGPDGMEIPKELRDFNLGSLIGVVLPFEPVSEDKKPKAFFIGSNLRTTAAESGRLLLRMYDSDPSDNSGKLDVEILGTFERQ
jgi:tetratricopeptide (TPR) repeat protein